MSSRDKIQVALCVGGRDRSSKQKRTGERSAKPSFCLERKGIKELDGRADGCGLMRRKAPDIGTRAGGGAPQAAREPLHGVAAFTNRQKPKAKSVREKGKSDRVGST